MNNGGALEALADLLSEWEQIWSHAAQIQSTFDRDILDAILHKTTDPGTALRDHASMLATLHPDVIAYVERTLRSAKTLLHDLTDQADDFPIPPRRRENDDILDARELTRRLRELETLVSGVGAVLVEARPRFDRRATSQNGDDGAGR